MLFSHTYQLLPLIPVEEFLSQHPEHADADENALMVARINHERAERETLEQQRLELQKRKQKLIAENKKRRDDLANLDKDLEKFIDVSYRWCYIRRGYCVLMSRLIGRQAHPENVREGGLRMGEQDSHGYALPHAQIGYGCGLKSPGRNQVHGPCRCLNTQSNGSAIS